MKKVKLMLLSLSILAIVGGALAFTVKTGTQYCTQATVFVDNKTTCPEFCDLGPSAIKAQVGSNVCTTVTNGNPQNPCASGTLRCNKTNPDKTIE